MNYPYSEQFRENLLEWYRAEKRDLPWRRTQDPYKIWVSEVMLQQTRVEAVIPYYTKFLERFPNLGSLAEAEEEQLLKQWEGLGYYSRVRNLQAGVREVVERYGGKVPDSREEISKLRGVGPYTAGAVLSIAYGVPEHAVDGNVMRVLSRVLLIEADIAKPSSRQLFERAVMELIDRDDPSSFNQGLMELGAIICVPANPRCLLCPVQESCLAFAEGRQRELPVKSKKKAVREARYECYVVMNERGDILLEKRPETGLLASMYQFPLALPEERAEWEARGFKSESALISFQHAFSHLLWKIDAFKGTLPASAISGSDRFRWAAEEELAALPLTAPAKVVWAEWKRGLS